MSGLGRSNPRRPYWGCEDDVLELGTRFERFAPSRFEVWWHKAGYRLPKRRRSVPTGQEASE